MGMKKKIRKNKRKSNSLFKKSKKKKQKKIIYEKIRITQLSPSKNPINLPKKRKIVDKKIFKRIKSKKILKND